MISDRDEHRGTAFAGGIVSDIAMIEIDAKGIHYRDLNKEIRRRIRWGAKHIVLRNVHGQRYIAAGIRNSSVRIDIHGTPGEDLGVFMDGPQVHVFGNAQNAVGNTMNDGKIVVHGMAGDVVGYGMRGGRVYVRDDVGYRVGIHMKGYMDKQPIIVVGGRAGDFFGEYMAGGFLVVLGATTGNGSVVGDYCATGMHGGVMYLRGKPRERGLGKEVKVFPLNDADVAFLKPVLTDFCETFNLDLNVFDFSRYCKIVPVSTRPYGRLYAY